MVHFYFNFRNRSTLVAQNAERKKEAKRDGSHLLIRGAVFAPC